MARKNPFTRRALIVVAAVTVATGALAARYEELSEHGATKARATGSHGDATRRVGPAAQATPRVSAQGHPALPFGSESVPQLAQVASGAAALRVTNKYHELWLSPGEFHPVGDSRQCALINDGSFLYRNSGPCTTYIARVPLPQGALWDGYTLVGVDNDPAAEMTLGVNYPTWRIAYTDSTLSPGAVEGYNRVGSGVSQASLGVIAVSKGGLNTTIDFYRWEGMMSYSYSYPVLALTLPASQNLSVYGVSLMWRKQYGPAPATPTFTDVQPQHPYFTEIEMLAQAGISNGCGSGQFCPNVNVTRGQMAVFLSRALGLYDDKYDNDYPQ
jgi:hypothetical protein